MASTREKGQGDPVQALNSHHWQTVIKQDVSKKEYENRCIGGDITQVEIGGRSFVADGV